MIRLTRDGDVIVEGPITTAQDVVARAALLLTDLLPAHDALPEYRPSGALQLVMARALGSMDLPPYASLEEFRAALSRFVTEDVRDVARALFVAWERARVTRTFKAAPRTDLTISDIRRARRATGLSLAHLAAVAEVPPTRLRDLEWGYMRDWPATPEARTQVIRYARAAGLDESIVLSIAWPMIVENAYASDPERMTSVALVPAPPRAIAVVHPMPLPQTKPARRFRTAVVAAVATVALLGAFALGWRSASPTSAEHDTVQVGLTGRDVPLVVSDRGVPPAARAGVIHAADTRVVDAEPEPRVTEPPVRVKPAATPSPVKAKARRPSASRQPPSREEPRREQTEKEKRSFFDRELFRIVIR